MKETPDFCLFFPIFPDFFPIIPDFPRFFLIFPDFWQIFAVRSGTLPPLPPQWLRHWCYSNCLRLLRALSMPNLCNCPGPYDPGTKFRGNIHCHRATCLNPNLWPLRTQYTNISRHSSWLRLNTSATKLWSLNIYAHSLGKVTARLCPINYLTAIEVTPVGFLWTCLYGDMTETVSGWVTEFVAITFPRNFLPSLIVTLWCQVRSASWKTIQSYCSSLCVPRFLFSEVY